MSPFEFVFSLFGLMLGLSLAEIFGGLARTVHARDAAGAEQVRRIGWLTPLLGLFVMLDLTSFWTVAWTLREGIPAHYSSLVAGLAITGIYYLAATFVFPANPADWPDLDLYYFRRRRVVLIAVALCNAVAIPLAMIYVGAWPQPLVLAMTLLYFGLIAACCLVRDTRFNIAGLAMLIGLYGINLFIEG